MKKYLIFWILNFILSNILFIHTLYALNITSKQANSPDRIKAILKAKENEVGLRDFVFSPDGRNLYVIDSVDTLINVDPQTGKIIKKLTITHLPDECYLARITITPDGKKIYLSTHRRNIYVINSVDLSLKNIIKTKPASFTNDMVMTAHSLFVADLRTYSLQSRAQINVIDTRRDEIFYRFSTKDNIFGFDGIGVTPNNRYVYVSDWMEGGFNDQGEPLPPSLSLYDTYTNTAYSSLIPEITHAGQIVIDSQHNKLYVGSDGILKGTVYVVDLTSNKLLKKLSFPETPSSYTPLVIGLAPDQSKLYIVQDQYVAILNTINDEIAGRIDLAQANAIHTGADPSKVYFSTKNYTISTVDVISNTIINTISIKD